MGFLRNTIALTWTFRIQLVYTGGRWYGKCMILVGQMYNFKVGYVMGNKVFEGL